MKLTITLEDTGNTVSWSLNRDIPFRKGASFTKAEQFAFHVVKALEQSFPEAKQEPPRKEGNVVYVDFKNRDKELRNEQ